MRKRRSRFPVSGCDCHACRAACTQSPGWFLPEQIPELAEHLGLSPEEAFRRHLAVGVTEMPDGSLRHGVMPHKLRDGKRPGSVWTLVELETPGRCIFFDRGLCTIYEVRPDECARMIHGDRHDAEALRHEIVDRWDDAALEPYRRLTRRRLFGSSPRPGGRRPATRRDPRGDARPGPRGDVPGRKRGRLRRAPGKGHGDV